MTPAVRRDTLEIVHTPSAHWRGYVTAFHDSRPAITERLLGLADSTPYDWLVEPLRTEPGPILDLACGSAPTRPLLPRARWAGLDSSSGELRHAATLGRGPLIRAGADALPIGTGTVSAVCAALCLQVITPLDAVLREARRVLRPGGMLAALVPARLTPWPGALLCWIRVFRALGITNLEWPEPRAVTALPRVLGQHGMQVCSSRRHQFSLQLSSPEHIDLLIDALYLPGVPAARVRAAQRTLHPWARPGRRLPLPLRRVVARTPVQ